jgi:phage gpG-like protein
VALTGDDAKLARLAFSLEGLAAKGGKTVSAAMARVAQGLVREEFAGGHGPDGAAWASPLDGGQPLVDSGALAASVLPRDTGSGIEADSGLPYAAIHQHGGEHTPARPFLPEGSLPSAWEGPIKTAAEEALDELLPKL